jgi:outer membrane lipoprotein-sorting protein
MAQRDERKGYKKATKAQRAAYFKWLNDGDGEVDSGTVFDGQDVWVRDVPTNTASQSSTSDSTKKSDG